MLTVITDETSEAAHAKHERLLSYASDEGSLVFMSGWMGVDLSRYDLDDPIGEVESNAIQSAVASFQQADPSGKEWTVRDIARWGGIGGMGPRVVGSPAEVADELQSWVDETDVDGFNLPYAVTPDMRDRWMRHMLAAMDTLDLPEAHDAAMRQYFTRAADMMINADEDGQRL